MPCFVLANADDHRATSGDHAIPETTLFGDPLPPGFGLLRTDSAYSSTTAISLTADCSLLRPALGFDELSGRYILVWVDYEPTSGGTTDTGLIKVRTSTNGSTWTSVQDLGIRTFETPGIACAGDGECVLTYVRGSSNDAYPVTRRITVGSGGTITLPSGAWSTVSDRTQEGEAVAYIGGSTPWLGVAFDADTIEWLSRGWGSFYFREDGDNPLNDSWSAIGESAERPGGLAGSDAYAYQYLFYID